MVKKIVHGIETCEDCRKLFLLVLDNTETTKSMSFRFNAMLKMCQKTLDPKYSPARLKRHLDGLEGAFVKKNKKGDLKSDYSLILPKTALDLSRLELEESVEKLYQLRLDRLVDLIINFYKWIAREQIIADIESILNLHTPQEYSAKMIIVRNFLRLKMDQYSLAMNNRPVTEYNEVLKRLKDERSGSK